MELIRQGQVGSAVEDVQRRLAELGLPCPDELGVFGDHTSAAVRTFQQQRGLAADGLVRVESWHALVRASFRLGDRLLYQTKPPLHGDDVRELQRRLNQLGFDCGYDDGLLGARTAAAIREFQLNVGMPVDGIAGPQTFGLLGRLHRQHQEAPAYAIVERELLTQPTRESLAGARIMLDPAHSPDDPGVRARSGIWEHQVTWEIARMAEGRLTALGAHVVLSRGPASAPSPSERARHANAENVEAILSVHVNGEASDHARGAAAYHFGTDIYVSERGRALADLAVDRVVNAINTANCRVHPSTSALLRESRAPAAIVEVGFLTHPTEGSVLESTPGQRMIADALVAALISYLLEPPESRTPAVSSVA